MPFSYMNFLMLSLIQRLKAETRVKTEGFLSLMQPWGPKLTIPCTSQVVFVPAAVQAKGPPESPYGRAREGALLFTSCVGEHLILTETINHLCVLEFVKTGQSNMWQSCLEGGKCHLSTVVKSFSKSLIFPCPVCMFVHYGEQIMFLCSGSLLQSRLTDHKQNSLHGCYVKDSPIIRG